MKSKTYLSIIVVTTLLLTGLTQKNKFIQYLDSLIKNHNSSAQLEKVYVQTDKTFYLPGEDIWFSVFLVNDGSNTPSNVSGVVYVDLVNPKGNVIAKRTLAAPNGNSEGDFHLDTLDAGGIYTIKAYTNWMKNFGEECFFEKKITVQKVITPRVLMKLDFVKEAYGKGDQVTADFNIKNLKNEPLKYLKIKYIVSISGSKISEKEIKTDEAGKAGITFKLPDSLTSNDGLLNITVDHEGFTESISRSVPIVLNRIDLQFFPEGGTFVSGLSNRIAFKALNEFGKPADIEGIVVDENDSVIAELASFHDGMGTFTITPQTGKVYNAKVIKPTGISSKFLLPETSAGGLTMKVDTIGKNEILLKINTLENRNVFLVAHQADKVFFSENRQLKQGENFITVPVEHAHTGTALLTLFDENKIPQNERLVFVNEHKKLNVDIESDKESYTPGAEVELKIKTTDEQGNPVSSQLSLSVVNDRIISFADDKQDNILSWLLMSSDLKGDIHEPNFYFNENEPKSRKALDLVMMTHGWRKFSWKEIDKPEPELAYKPEKIGDVSGVILNRRKNSPIKAEVYAFEVSPKRRAAKTETDETGRFTIKGVDPSHDLVIMASAPFKNRNNINIKVDNEYLESINNRPFQLADTKNDDPNIPTVIKAQVKENKNSATQSRKNGTAEENNLSFSLTEDITSLEEVVVVGYGATSRSDITAAITVVREEDISIVPYSSVVDALQGRATGIAVSENPGIVGNFSNISIRGVNSVSNNSPLFVVDGIPVANGNQSPDPQHIKSIEVLKGPSASAIYGCRGVNGVILISTSKSRWNYNNRIGEKSYAQYRIYSRKYYRAREFYRPSFYRRHTAQKEDLSSTVFWKPDILTDLNGEATVHFRNSNEVSNFRITIEGISKTGMVGRKEQTLHTVLPLNVDTKIPPFLCFGDSVMVPIILKNSTSEVETGKLTLEIPSALEKITDLPEQISLNANSTHTEWIKFKVKNKEGRFKIKAVFAGTRHSDELVKSIQILPMGFPVQASLSGYDLSKNFEFDLNNAVAGSVKAKFTGYTSTLNELMEGIASVIRAPYGCFEQTSSSTYPNVLALNLIRETGLQDKKMEKTAEGYIKQGYKRLLTFETKGGGFEWFGATPAHEGLTAYGLMEFYDMKKVFGGVSDALIERTVKWLLDRKSGKGGFKRSDKALDSFGRSSKAVSDAYITYAFTEIEKGHLVIPEFNRAYAEAIESKDAYRMALMANAALNIGENEKADLLTSELLKALNPDGSGELKAEHSMVRSYGNSLQVEIRSLLLMALLKQKNAPHSEIVKLVKYISSKRNYGGFGSTQATILSLKALCMYARLNPSNGDDGNIEVLANNKKIVNETFSKNSPKSVSVDNLEGFFANGTHQIMVNISETQNPIPYSLDVSWTSLTPDSSPNCKLAVSTNVNTHKIKLGETVRMEVTLRNKRSEGLPMTMAIIGIPAGLSAQAWQLKELQEKSVFDFYEIRDNYLVLYYRQMEPGSTKTIHLDLKSESPGVFQAPASSAYLYYTNEDKHWVDGEKIKIEL